MRIFASSLCSSVLSVVIFAALWSEFVVQHHSYGGDSRASRFGGTLLYFCIYLLPVMVAVSAIVSFAGEKFAAKKKIRALVAWRWITWLVASLLVLGGLTMLANPLLWSSAVICSAAAGIFGGAAYFSLLKKKEANQPSEPTAASGRGSH